jgi:putative membrane protein
MGALLAGVVVLATGCMNESSESPVPGLSTRTVELTDAQILRVMQVANESEIAFGALGQSRASTASVRDFSVKMVTEHTVAREELGLLAVDQELRPADSELSSMLMADAQHMMAEMDSLEGTRFDLALMDVQLALHARTAMLLDSLLLSQSDNEALRQMLMVQRKAVQGHLEEALPIQKALFDAPAP